jgi:hypothetical protein
MEKRNVTKMGKPLVCQAILPQSRILTCVQSKSGSSDSSSEESFKSPPVCNGHFCAIECANQEIQCNDILYFQIGDSFFSDMSQAIYHQYLWQQSMAQTTISFLEVQKEIIMPINKIVKGTEAHKDSPIFGYDIAKTGEFKLDRAGGREKSYPKSFTEFRLKYNGANVSELAQDGLTLENTIPVVERILSYFMERGYQVPPPDVPNKFKNQFIWSLDSGYVAIRFIYLPHKDYPSFVDLVATASPNTFNLDTWEPDPFALKNGHGYPIRIPITTDFCGKFQQSMNNGIPVAYWDQDCSTITIAVPPTEGGGYLILRENDDTGNPDLNFNAEDYLTSFFGTFKILKRQKRVHEHATRRDSPSRGSSSASDREDSQLIPAHPRDADVLAQISQEMYISSRFYDGAEVETGVPFEFFLPLIFSLWEEGESSYTGAVLPRLSGGTESFDIYVVPVPDVNAYAASLDPSDVGDSPLTLFGEDFGVPSAITLFDNSEWRDQVWRIPHNVMLGEVCPEKISKVPALQTVSVADAFHIVAGHEFMHSMQDSSGSTVLLPAESMAAGIEMDSRLNIDLFIGFRSRSFAQRHVRLTRGSFTAMTPDSQGATTYGVALFWKYLADQFDPNYQVGRRLMDILAGETAGPLFEKHNYPTMYVATNINNTGGNAALKQSLRELHNRKLGTVWFDFSVALVLLRNNKAIPKEYRTHYPVWLWSQKYGDFATLAAAEQSLDAGSTASNWWDRVDTNQLITADWNTDFTNESVVATLNGNFVGSCKNYHTFSFNIPHSTESVEVAVTEGKWRVMVFQFTPSHKGECEGHWIQDGHYTLRSGESHKFKIEHHKPQYSSTGNIRLVCANITALTGDGTRLDDYFQPESDSGIITITSN